MSYRLDENRVFTSLETIRKHPIVIESITDDSKIDHLLIYWNEVIYF